MQGILTAGLVSEAFDQIRPYIESFLNSGVPKRAHLAVVVTATAVINPQDPNKSFEENCYLVTGFGNQSEWQSPYKKIALSKAEKSARTGKATAELPPHYLLDQDTLFWGSVVLDDIVVACSGVESHYDEMIAMCIAAAIKAAAKRAFEEYRKKDPTHVLLDETIGS